jgi:hypothetical protein
MEVVDDNQTDEMERVGDEGTIPIGIGIVSSSTSLIRPPPVGHALSALPCTGLPVPASEGCDKERLMASARLVGAPAAWARRVEALASWAQLIEAWQVE